MVDGVITLIGETLTKNSYGALVSIRSSREVLCQCRSVGRADFYSGQQAGHSLSYVFVTNPVNYNGELEVEYEGERYSIVRTYQSDADTLEIYAGFKVGVRYGSDGTSQSDTP